jgi:GT2 family glycosyltransferase
VILYPYGVNRGLATSWNEGILAAYDMDADIVIVANDDIVFSEGDLDKMAEKAVANRDRYIVTCAGFHEGHGTPSKSHGYSCFAINPISIETIGMFDQNIFPIYMEDCDYAYRAGLAGLTEENCPDTNVKHNGSSAINVDHALGKQNIFTHRKNSEYYHRKWGGSNGSEAFKWAFEDEEFPQFYIAPENKDHPYGDYDRTDQYIVKF